MSNDELHKTPRRVQFSEPSAHELDTHALDPDAFEALTHSLERHQALTRGSKESSSTKRGDEIPNSKSSVKVKDYAAGNEPQACYGVDVERDAQLPLHSSTTTSTRTGLLSALRLLTFNDSRSDLSTPSASRSSSLDRHKPKLTRPPKLHTNPGVFAPLIASTGNLSGAAAPVNSTLAPTIHRGICRGRPGYHLTRYSLDGVPTRTGFDPRPEETSRSNLHLNRLHIGSAPGSPTESSTPTTSSPSPPPSGAQTPLQSRRKWTGILRDLPTPFREGSFPSPLPTPNSEVDDAIDEKWASSSDRGRRKEKEREKKEETRKKRKKAEVYIIRHVASLLQRHHFLLKLIRALMMFGGPSHRFPAILQSSARVLDVSLSCVYLPDVMIVSFDDTGLSMGTGLGLTGSDAVTGLSGVQIVRQAGSLDLGKLRDAYGIYWKVIHDEISLSTASSSLDFLMRKPPLYGTTQLIILGALCSASICSVSFSGSFVDSLIAAPLGALLVAVRLFSIKNELYVYIFEITIATILSFLSAALASTHVFCYSAVASSSVVLILPGFIVLNGALELSSHNIVSGAVRLCYAVIYSLFLGFGLAIGGEVYQKVAGQNIVGPEDYTCAISHIGPWWRSTPSTWWAFLTVPMYSLVLSMRNQAPWDRKELTFAVLISCIGWVTNHFTGTKFPNQSDISAAVGAFAVGLVSNIYGRLCMGNAFVVMITGILFQLPSGLGNGGLLTFASQQTSGSSTSYLSGFQTALQLISVSIGLTVGLGVSLAVVHPILSRKRAAGVFSL